MFWQFTNHIIDAVNVNHLADGQQHTRSNIQMLFYEGLCQHSFFTSCDYAHPF